MKNENVLFNPFRMLSPRLDHEMVKFEELHDKPFTESISLQEGLLVMMSKIIEMSRLLSKCLISGFTSQMDKCEALAKEVNGQEKVLTSDLIKSEEVTGNLLKGLIRFPYRMERIGDMLESILNCCRAKAKFGIPFSEKACAELDQLFGVLIDMMVNLRDAFLTPNKAILDRIISDGKRLGDMLEDFKVAHWTRLEMGFCAVEASSMYRDILDSVKSVNEYLVKMSRTLLDFGQDTSLTTDTDEK